MKNRRLTALEAALKHPAMASRAGASGLDVAYPRSSSRAGKRHVGVWITHASWSILRALATREERSAQSLMEEALADLLRKHGMPASD